ncbi:hypothetical protein [Sphaerochaeta pleomorpha]|uniref:hypothetical protein n=1 Tax=Sphaerochaeta pleomorpha TaxID=1131707 RepID=UPI0003032C1F|nr:hypothetical protein [Sphaerochaeta pleomorpha]
MSSKKPYFPNLRSAVISIAVVCVLLVLAVLVIDRSTVMRLNRYMAKVETAREDAIEQIDLRFSYAGKLSILMSKGELGAPLSAAVSLYAPQMDIEGLSLAYNSLDSVLSNLQKQIYQEPDYLLYLAYFEKLYDCETALTQAVLTYNGESENFNRQISAFPAKFIAKRLGMEPMVPFSIAKALKSRP